MDYNVPERLDAFVVECDKLFNVTRGNDIMLTMGTDFTVRAAAACPPSHLSGLCLAKRPNRHLYRPIRLVLVISTSWRL